MSDDAWTHQRADPLRGHASLPPADSATPLDAVRRSTAPHPSAGSSSSSSLAPQCPGHAGPPLEAHAIARLMVRLFRRSDAPPHASDGLHRVALRELLCTRRSPAYRAKLLDQDGEHEAPSENGSKSPLDHSGSHEAARENTGPRECMDVSAKTLRAMWSEQPVSRRGAPRMTEQELERNLGR